jgi:glycosyltransferase involved in cell wall biosynthesis
MKISVAMIVKNEEQCITRCLRSVADADEIVVVDTGSTDATCNVIRALSLNNVVLSEGDFAWCDDFSAARNFSLSLCTGDWVLIIDADDWLGVGGIQSIREAAENCKNNVMSVIMIHDGTTNSYELTRVARVGGPVFEGRVHEVLSESTFGSPVATMYIGRSPNHDIDKDIDLRILKKEHAEDPTKPRTMYYLAREYMYKAMYTESLNMFAKYIGCSTFLAEKADALLYVARIFWKMGRGDDARATCMSAITINANFREALNFMASISFEHNAVRWREFAKLATNERVLFVRN